MVAGHIMEPSKKVILKAIQTQETFEEENAQANQSWGNSNKIREKVNRRQGLKWFISLEDSKRKLQKGWEKEIKVKMLYFVWLFFHHKRAIADEIIQDSSRNGCFFFVELTWN